MTNIAIIGASADRSKFGNKCTRAYLSKGHTVFPVNPTEERIEGLKCYKSILEIKEKVGIVSIYLPSSAIQKVVPEIIKKKPSVVYFNPGAEDLDSEEKLRKSGIEAKEKCCIAAIGLSPGMFEDE